jgi:hypothetical protein
VGDGLGVPFGEPVGEGLGELFGVPVGLPVGEPVGVGVAVTLPKTPARTAAPALLICIDIPSVITGTVWPLLVSRFKTAVLNCDTVAFPATALFTETLKTVPTGKFTDDAWIPSLRRPVSSTRYSAKPAGDTPPIGAPLNDAPIRVSVRASASTVLLFKANGAITHRATRQRVAANLNIVLFSVVLLILVSSSIIVDSSCLPPCEGSEIVPELRFVNETVQRDAYKRHRTEDLNEKSRAISARLGLNKIYER